MRMGPGTNLRNIQGYIHAPCTHEPACIPADAQKLRREYNTANQDRATFLESERTGASGFETRSYTDACPAGNNTKMIGHVYSTCTPCGAGIYTLPCTATASSRTDSRSCNQNASAAAPGASGSLLRTSPATTRSGQGRNIEQA